MSNTQLTYGQWLVLTALGLMTVIVGLLATLGIGLWFAWWLYPAWGWFIVPLGFPSISLWHFWALITLFRFERVKPGPKEPKEAKQRTKSENVVFGVMLVLQPIILWAIFRWLAEAP